MPRPRRTANAAGTAAAADASRPDPIAAVRDALAAGGGTLPAVTAPAASAPVIAPPAPPTPISAPPAALQPPVARPLHTIASLSAGYIPERPIAPPAAAPVAPPAAASTAPAPVVGPGPVFDFVQSNVKGGFTYPLSACTAIVGPNGAGKCLPGATRLYDPVTGPVSLQTVVEERRTQVLGPVRGKMQSLPVTDWHTLGEKPMVEVFFDDGTSEVVGAEHPLLTPVGSQRASSLSVGAAVAAPLRLPVQGQTRLSNAEVALIALIIADGSRKTGGFELAFKHPDKIAALQWCVPEIFPYGEARRTGSSAAGDCYAFYVRPREDVDRVTLAAELEGLLAAQGHQLSEFFVHNGAVSMVRAGRLGCSDAIITAMEATTQLDLFRFRSAYAYGRAGQHWLARVGLEVPRAAHKCVPEKALAAPDNQVALLLAHLWLCDGYVSASTRHSTEISYSTASIRLAEDVAYLLRRLGIGSTRGTKWVNGRPYYNVYVPRWHRDRFHALVKIPGAKGRRLTAMIECGRARTRAGAVRRGGQRIPYEFAALNVPPLIGDWSPWRRKRRDFSCETFRSFGGATEVCDAEYQWKRVVRVETRPPQPAFDITVDSPEHLYAFGQLIGHNSSALHAIRLALTGRDPIGSSAEALLALADGDRLTVLLKGPHASAEYSLSAGKRTPVIKYGGALEPLQALSEAQLARILPLSSIDDLLALGPGRAREEVFARFGANEGQGDGSPAATTALLQPPAGFGDEQIKLWAAGVKDAQVSAETASEEPVTPTDVLAALPSVFRQQKLAAGREVTRLKTNLGEAVQQEAAPTPQELSALEQQLLHARGRVQQHEKVHGIQQRYEAITNRYREVASLLVSLGAPPAEPPEESVPQAPSVSMPASLVPPMPASLVQQRATVQRLRTDAQQAVEILEQRIRPAMHLRQELKEIAQQHGQAACFLCSTQAGPEVYDQLLRSGQQTQQMYEHQLVALRTAEATLQEMEQQYAATVQEAERQAQEAMRQRYQAQAAETGLRAQERAKRQQHRDRYHQLQQEAAALTAESNGLSAAWTEIGGEKVLADPPSADELGRLEQQIVKARSLTTVRADRERIEASIRAETRRQEILSGLEREATEVLARATQSIGGRVEAAVAKYLPDGFTAKLKLYEGLKAVFRWEVTGKDGTVHRKGAASGAEWSALRIAFACACTEGAPVRVLLLDDQDLAGFSPANVRKLLEMVREKVTQGVLTQCVVAWSRGDEIPPEGWTMVQAGRTGA